jgi:uncharacterized damage-inducible protein DinB
MAISADTIRGHIDYTAWASGLLVDAARQLSPEELKRDFGTADKSVLGTLVHIFAADRVWLRRIHGQAPSAFIEPEDRDFARLQEAWPAVHRGWKEWAAGLSDAQAMEDISFRDMAGNPYQQPVWQIVLHLVNHGTHHRGAVAGFLRAMGHTPPKLDLIFYYRSLQAAAGASR